MPRSCLFERPGLSKRADWRLEPEQLVVTPDGAPTEVYNLRELRGIDGDDYAVDLVSSPGTIKLSRLGGDGAGLLADLQKTWLALRAGALRVAGTGSGKVFRGSVASETDTQPRPCLLMAFGDVLLCAPLGADVRPYFLAHFETVELDDVNYHISLKRWDRSVVTLTRLAGQTNELATTLRGARATLAAEATSVLAGLLPTLTAAARTSLASAWLPGLLRSLAELATIVSDTRPAIETSWIAPLARRSYYNAIATWADAGQLWLGYTRPGVGAAPPEGEDALVEDSDGTSEAGSDASEPANSPESAPRDAEPVHLWLLARRGSSWLLENLSATGFATYRFSGAQELVVLCSKLLAAPQFSREALYLPLAALTRERAELAVAARDLDFLADLRAHFSGRIIHTSVASWQKSLAGPTGSLA